MRRHRHKVECTVKYSLFFISLLFKLIITFMDIGYNIDAYKSYKFNNLEEIKNLVNEKPPLFNFLISQNQPSSKYIPYKSFYTWKGTYKIVRSGKSGRKAVQNIPAVSIIKLYQNMFYYKNVSKSYFDYLNNIDDIKSANQSCKNNYKKCGILDTNNNILCIPINEECPLNDLKISDVKLPDLEPEYSFVKVTESLTDSVKYIYYTNNKTDNNVITHFELSTNNPCIYPDEHNWIGIDPKEIEKNCSCKTYINNELYDKSYKEVGNKILMKSLYYDNNVSLYNEYNYETVNLYVRNHYYFDQNCFEKYIEVFDNLETSYTSKINALRFLQYINFFLVVIYIIIFFISYIKRNEDEDISKKCNLVITDLIILYGIVINIIFLFFRNGDKLNFSCGNQNINTKIDNIFNNEFSLQRILFYSIINIVVGVILLIPNTYFFLVD